MASNPTAAQGRSSLGLILCVVSALSFAAGSSSAVLSYQAGVTPVSLITTRILFTVGVLWLFIRVTGGTTRLPRRDRNIALALGVLLGAQSYALYQAIELIPVALAILTFYLYPLMIGIGVHFTGREPITKALAAGLVGAFIGLALALDVTGDGLHGPGIALAAASAATFTVIAMVTQPLIARAGDSRPITLHMHYTAAVVFIGIDIVLGSFPLPSGTTGWIAFAAVPVFYSIAITTFFIAFAHIGPVRTSLVMNLEPIASIAFGFVLLGQVLTPMQLTGAAVVIVSISAVRLEGARRAKRS